MPNLIEIVGRFADVFDRLQIRFAVGGALANNYWGVVRTTKDVDCLIALPAIKYQLLADELAAIGCLLCDEQEQLAPVSVAQMLEQVRQRKLIDCVCEAVHVELFVPIVPLQEQILLRAVPKRLGDREAPITTPEDLILLKLVFHRTKDLLDVRGILWVQRGKLDLDYMKHWSARTLEPEIQQEMERLIAEYAHE
jgi:hypothetical protein